MIWFDLNRSLLYINLISIAFARLKKIILKDVDVRFIYNKELSRSDLIGVGLLKNQIRV